MAEPFKNTAVGIVFLGVASCAIWAFVSGEPGTRQTRSACASRVADLKAQDCSRLQNRLEKTIVWRTGRGALRSLLVFM